MDPERAHTDSSLKSPTSIKSPSWYQPLPKLGGFKSHRGSIQKKSRVTADNESEKSLKGTSLKESQDLDGMRIMVDKSFFITNEER
jgi:hypothetical protein